MRTEHYCRNRSVLPRLTRAQQLHYRRVQNKFIQDIINTDELGPCLEIKYFFHANHPTPSVPEREFAKDLTNRRQIILQLAYWIGTPTSFTLTDYPAITGRQSGKGSRSHPLTGRLESTEIKPSNHNETKEQDTTTID